MKRFLSVLLVLVMLISALPIGAAATSATKPVYTSYADINYMAHDILSQMDLSGKSDRDQILTVYQWIINNCRREGAPDAPHYDASSRIQ